MSLILRVMLSLVCVMSWKETPPSGMVSSPLRPDLMA